MLEENIKSIIFENKNIIDIIDKSVMIKHELEKEIYTLSVLSMINDVELNLSERKKYINLGEKSKYIKFYTLDTDDDGYKFWIDSDFLDSSKKDFYSNKFSDYQINNFLKPYKHKSGHFNISFKTDDEHDIKDFRKIMMNEMLDANTIILWEKLILENFLLNNNHEHKNSVSSNNKIKI